MTRRVLRHRSCGTRRSSGARPIPPRCPSAEPTYGRPATSASCRRGRIGSQSHVIRKSAPPCFPSP
eukprot:1844151-Prymnesium_polylepis.1